MNNKAVSFLLFCFALFGLLASSCKRDDPKTIISGRVTEYGTNAPIQNAKVYVLCHSGGIFDPIQNGNLYDTLFTDSDGRFYREYLDKNLCDAAYLAFYKPGYFFHNDVDVSTGENYFEVVLDPEAWLNIVTVPDLGGNSIKIAGSNFYGGAYFEANSIEGEMNRVFLTRGNEKKYIRWYSGPNLSILHKDSIFLHAHDSVSYTIHY